MPSKVYAARKARMERDPEFKARVLASQAASRRRRREEQYTESRVCGYPLGGDRRCWKEYVHTHRGLTYDPAKGNWEQRVARGNGLEETS
jgi:hypothetical protein